jgi:hypothetical protein
MNAKNITIVIVVVATLTFAYLAGSSFVRGIENASAHRDAVISSALSSNR